MAVSYTHLDVYKRQQLMDRRMKEVHLFIPTENFELPAKQGKNAIKPCYLDVKSGFVNFADDSSAGKAWIRKSVSYTHLDVYKRQSS